MNIEDIKDPSFIKNLNKKELNELASSIRNFIIENVSKTGGHLSSNLGSVELTIALHKVFDGLSDKILFDVGHQTYTHKILTGRAHKFNTLRSFNGLSGFIKKNESQYDIFESGHSSTSISTAIGMAKIRNKENKDYSIISVIGDASIANGVAFEALNNIKNDDRVIIVLNDNDMSITKSVGALAKSLSKIRTSKTYDVVKKGYVKIIGSIPFVGKPIIKITRKIINKFYLLFRTSNIFDSFELSYLGPIDGHNIKSLTKAFNKAKKYRRSILIHVKTKKGYGYKLAENDKSGKWHGTLPFNIESGEINTICDYSNISYSDLVGSRLDSFMNIHNDVYLISAAMSTGAGLDCCFIKYPDRCFDVGIAEEHAIAFANGIAMSNKYPVVSMYSTFLQRGYDQILHDIARTNAKMMFLVDRAGLVGQDGETHHGIFDVSFLYPLPNVMIAHLPEGKFLDGILEFAYSNNCPFFIRYEKNKTNNLLQVKKKIDYFKFKKAFYDKENIASIIVIGDLYLEVLNYVTNHKLKINVLTPFLLKPIDTETLNEISEHMIYVYDLTSVYDGFSSEILKYLCSINKNNFKAFTLPNKFIQHGSNNDLIKSLKLDVESVFEKILNDLGDNNEIR